jgi:Zinc knuckle
MVLGALGEQPVCFYCNKPGHLKKDCFKLRNDLASRGGRRGNGRNSGGRNGGRYMGNRLNAIQETDQM